MFWAQCDNPECSSFFPARVCANEEILAPKRWYARIPVLKQWTGGEYHACKVSCVEPARAAVLAAINQGKRSLSESGLDDTVTLPEAASRANILKLHRNEQNQQTQDTGERDDAARLNLAPHAHSQVRPMMISLSTVSKDSNKVKNGQGKSQ